MAIIGVDNMTVGEVKSELDRGARFVVYQYCFSIVIMTFMRPSSIYFIRAGQSAIVKGIPFILISFLFGWWGIPWGPIRTIQSLVTNFSGGKNITNDVVAALIK